MNISIITGKYPVLWVAFLMIAFTVLSITQLSTDILASTSNVTSIMLKGSYITDRPAFISLANISDQQQPVGEIKPLITSGENLSNGYSFPGVPDGLGVVELENGTVDVYLNHEYDTEENGQNAKVSKLSTLSYFSDNANKTVVLGFEDGAETESEVYMYVADTPKDLLFGKGRTICIWCW